MTPAVQALQLTPPSTWGFVRREAEQETPSSNTGFSQNTALIDYLSVTVPRSALRAPDCYQLHALPLDAHELKCHLAANPGLAQQCFNTVFPGTAISARAFEAKGLFGYQNQSALHVAGVEGQVGVMGIGGNDGTLYISLSGAGTAWLRDLRKFALCLEAVSATITRVDLAFDDFYQEHIDYGFICDLARAGYFDADNGNRVLRRKVDDLGSLRGSSLYIGKKGVKELCIYEKGKQLQHSNAAWIRVEVRIWAKNRVIPYDVLTNPGAYMRGEYPSLSPFLPWIAPKRSQVMKAEADASIEGAERWMLHAAGKTLNFLRRAADRADAHPSDLIFNLSRDGTPKRFAGVPEEIAFQRAKPKFNQGVLHESHHFQRESVQEIRHLQEGFAV